METTRQNKIARLIQKELSEMFQAQTRAMHGVGKRVRYQLRIIPELKFFVDDSLDYAAHIDELLKK